MSYGILRFSTITFIMHPFFCYPYSSFDICNCTNITVLCLCSSNSYHFTHSFALAINFIVPCTHTHTHTHEVHSNFIIHSKVFGSLIDALQRRKFARSPHCVALRFSFGSRPPSPCLAFRMYTRFYFPAKFRVCVCVSYFLSFIFMRAGCCCCFFCFAAQ